MSPSLIQSVALKLHTELKFKKSVRGNLTLNNKAVAASKIFKTCLEFLSEETHREIIVESGKSYIDLQKQEAGNLLIKEIEGLLEGNNEAPDHSTIKFSEDVPFLLSDLKLIINLTSKKRSALWHQPTDLLLKFDYDLVMDRLLQLLGKKKDVDLWISSNSRDCFVEYRPNREPLFKDEENGNLFVFNTWRPAPWAINWEAPTKKTKPPKLYQEFLSHLIPDTESRLATEAWLRDATFDRAKSVLVLAGSPGTGKNLFIEGLSKALVGENNFQLASGSYVGSAFQAQHLGCRLFFVDEKDLDKKARDAFKAIHNSYSTAERKHTEVGKQERIYASLAIANNYIRDVKLEYSDRKFFVPELPFKSLLDSWGEANITEFAEKLLDISFLQEIAAYLYSNYKAGASAKFPKTEFFKKLCIRGYPQGFKTFIQLCKQKEIVLPRDLKNKKNLFTREALEDEIAHYEANFREKLAVVEGIGHSWSAKSFIYKGGEDEIDNTI